MEASMNAAFSFQISIGIIAFGIWTAAGTTDSSAPLACALMGLLTVIVGSISVYQTIRDLKLA
jgi:xanthosine utilization system XapX-like protein